MNPENRKEWRPTAGIAMVIALVAIYAGGYLVLSARMPRKKEADGAGICAAMPQMLRAMKQTLRIEAYVSPVDDNLKAFAKSLDALLAQYKAAGAGKVEYHITEVNDVATRARAMQDGAEDQPWASGGIKPNNLGDVTRVFNSVVMHYGKDKAAMPFIEPSHPEALEFWITSKLREIVSKEDVRSIKIGILAGHGEIKVTDRNLVPGQMGSATMQSVIAQNMPYYTLVPVDLQKGGAAIDDALAGLIITQPATDLDDAELARIDDFVMKGKSLAIFAGAANVRAGDATMHATLGTHGLEKLLAGYGIELRSDVLLDFGHAFKLQAQGANGPEDKPFPMVPLVGVEPPSAGSAPGAVGPAPSATRLAVPPPNEYLDVTFPTFFRLSEVAFPFPSSIVLHSEKQPTASARVLARTSASTTRITTPQIDLDPLHEWKPEGATARQDVAASVEGTLRSAFGTAKSAKPARVLVVASAEFLANPFARAANPDMTPGVRPPPPSQGDQVVGQIGGQYAQQVLSTTIVSFKNTLDWLAPDDPFTACPAVLPPSPGGAGRASHGRPPGPSRPR